MAVTRGDLLLEDVAEPRGWSLDLKKTLARFLRGLEVLSVSDPELADSAVSGERACFPKTEAWEYGVDFGLNCGLSTTLVDWFQFTGVKSVKHLRGISLGDIPCGDGCARMTGLGILAFFDLFSGFGVFLGLEALGALLLLRISWFFGVFCVDPVACAGSPAL